MDTEPRGEVHAVVISFSIPFPPQFAGYGSYRMNTLLATLPISNGTGEGKKKKKEKGRRKRKRKRKTEKKSGPVVLKIIERHT